jgi:hypothetical protein
MTENPRVVQSLRQHIARYSDREVRILRESAGLKAAAISHTAQQLARQGVRADSAAQAAAGGAALLQQVDLALSSRRYEQAYEAAVAAGSTLDRAAAELRRIAAPPSLPISNPLVFDDDTLADYVEFERGRSSLQYGENLLFGGDFEDLEQLTQIGWQHFSRQSPGLESRAELSVDDPRHGRYCLMLHATASATPLEADEPSVWIESPPVAATAGQMSEITGWARVESTGNDDGYGLHILDSAGGSDLALAIHQTNGWEPFRIIRAVPENMELRLTFALSGMGNAQLDAVMVRPIERPSARRLPSLSPAPSAATTSLPTAAGPLLVSPQSP